MNKIKTYIFTLTNYAVDAFTHPPLKKSTFSPIFPDFSNFLLMVSFAYLHFLILLVTIRKCEKMSSKKNTKKGIFFFNTLFYFLKMDKNKCPKTFLKKKFQKTEELYLFLFIENSPFRWSCELSLYLSTFEEIESGINVEMMTIANA